MSLTISREQRDALYELVINHLTGIGDDQGGGDVPRARAVAEAGFSA
jgi:hypothetical protein